MEHSPNFLTCPAFPELPPPREPDFTSEKSSQDSPKSLTKDSASNPFIALRPEDTAQQSTSPFSEKSKTVATPIKPRKKRFFKFGIIFAVLLILLLIISPALYALGKASWSGYQAKIALEKMQMLLEAGEFESAKQEAGAAAEQFASMQKYLKNIGLWRDIPYMGVQIRGLESAAQVSSQSLEGMEDILHVAVAMQEALKSASIASGQAQVDVAEYRLQDLSPAERRALLSSLYQSLPEIRLARDKIDIALSLWESIPQDKMATPIKNALAPLVKFLPVMQQSLEQSVPLIEVFVPLLGYPNPQSYVITTQNADEIRPAGGFIGSVIATEIDAGNINTFNFFDVYNIDNPVSGVWNETPPFPIQKYLGINKWFMRDANWSPDFPTSAELVLDFYERERSLASGSPWPKQDGLVAVEPGFFKALLTFTGPIVVREKTFNSANFMDVLQYEVEMASGITVENRKDLMSEIAEAIFAKIQTMPRSDWPKLINIITTALDQKQILIYNRDPEIQSYVDARNWSARAKPTIRDFVWIIDANLGALKTDGVMSKSIQYTLDARDLNHPQVNLTLSYTNTNPQITWRNTRYRSYTRVYVPEGSRLISSSGAMEGDLVQTRGRLVPGQVDVMKELGKTVFGAFWSIEPGKTGKLSFTYELPANSVASILDGVYRLDWPKQSGADNTEFNVKILFPMNVRSANPPELQEKWGDNIYEAQTHSLFDRIFTIQLDTNSLK